MNTDLRWMDYALRLGRRALGATAENPPVGCVIVTEDTILQAGSGYDISCGVLYLRVPELKADTDELRQMLKTMKLTHVNLDWT